MSREHEDETIHSDKPIKGEVIESIFEHHNCEWMLFKMKSGRVFRATSFGGYGGESSLDFDEVRPELWDEVNE